MEITNRTCFATIMAGLDAAGKTRMISFVDKRPSYCMLLSVGDEVEAKKIVDEEVVAGILTAADSTLIKDNIDWKEPT